ncbi:MAG: exosortase C-terminal domain/associated protein EpsI [Terriglobales bacterium]
MISWNARVATVAVLLAGTALFLQLRARNKFALPSTALASFPVELKNWTGTDVPIPDEILKTLRPGQFLQRTYTDRSGSGAYVDLYVAYLLNQHALFRHLPEDCLMGSGWNAVESDTTTLALPGGAPFRANRYLIARGDDRQLVLFWYSAHGRRVASEDWMNAYLAFDSLRLNRSDNALIRMNTELQPGEKPEEAERRLLAFAGLVNPLLKSYIPL